MPRKIHRILLFILLIGLVFRAYHIDYPFAGYQSLKETQFAGMADLFMETGDYFTPTSYYEGRNNYNVFLPAWPVVLSWSILGESEFAARLPFVFVSMLSICLMYLLGRELYGEKAGLFAAFFSAVSPFMAYFGRNVQAEGLMIFFSILAVYSVVLYQKTGRDRHLWLCSLSLMLSSLCKFTMLYLFLPIGVWLYLKRKDSRSNKAKLFIAALIPLAATAIYLAYLQTIPATYFSLYRTYTTPSDLLDLKSMLYRAVYLVGGANPVILGLALLYLAGIVRGKKADQDWLVLSWLIGYFATYSSILKIATVGNNYYLISFIPPLILGASKASLDRLKDGGRALFACLLALVLSAATLYVMYDAYHPEKEAGEKIRSLIKDDEAWYRIGNPGACYYAKHFCYSDISLDWEAKNYTYLSVSSRFYEDQIGPNQSKVSYLSDNFVLLYNISGKRNILKGNNFELKSSPEYELIYARRE